MGLPNPAGRTVAKPLHLMESSGQYASGQVCRGSSSPCALRCKAELRATAPRAHGTPKLTPVFERDAFSPSQERVTFCAAAEAAGACANAEPRGLSASVLVVIAALVRTASFRNSRRLVS